MQIPDQGEKITMNGAGLNVPDRPIIPFIRGDGTGRDIWRATERVLDAAVSAAYGGQAAAHVDGNLRGRGRLGKV